MGKSIEEMKAEFYAKGGEVEILPDSENIVKAREERKAQKISNPYHELIFTYEGDFVNIKMTEVMHEENKDIGYMIVSVESGEHFNEEPLCRDDIISMIDSSILAIYKEEEVVFKD